MKYTYNYKNGKINVYVPDENEDQEVVISIGNKSHDGYVLEDEDGKYFTFKEEKIYLRDLEPIDLNYLINKVNKKKQVSSAELCQVLKNGPIKLNYINADQRFDRVVELSDDPKYPLRVKIELKDGSDNVDVYGHDSEILTTGFGISCLINMGEIKLVAWKGL